MKKNLVVEGKSPMLFWSDSKTPKIGSSAFNQLGEYFLNWGDVSGEVPSKHSPTISPHLVNKLVIKVSINSLCRSMEKGRQPAGTG